MVWWLQFVEKLQPTSGSLYCSGMHVQREGDSVVKCFLSSLLYAFIKLQWRYTMESITLHYLWIDVCVCVLKCVVLFVCLLLFFFVCVCTRVHACVCVRIIISLSSHLSLNREGRLGITDDFTTSFLHFSLPLPSGTWRIPGLSIHWCWQHYLWRTVSISTMWTVLKIVPYDCTIWFMSWQLNFDFYEERPRDREPW